MNEPALAGVPRYLGEFTYRYNRRDGRRRAHERVSGPRTGAPHIQGANRMTKRKKGGADFPSIPFDEALERLINTEPKELTDAFQRNKQRSDEIEQSAGERRNRLRRAI
jgi:hypothetical protein